MRFTAHPMKIIHEEDMFLAPKLLRFLILHTNINQIVDLCTPKLFRLLIWTTRITQIIDFGTTNLFRPLVLEPEDYSGSWFLLPPDYSDS